MRNGWRRRPVILTRPDGSEVEYPSQNVASAGEKFKIMQTSISLLCRGVKQEIGGYKARFKDSSGPQA